MTRYLDLLAEVLWPDGTCAACRDSRADRCPQHTQDLADHEAVLAAIKAVEDAETEEQALDAYRSCPTGLVESEKAEGRGAS
jgi:hypothetical protein